MFRTAVAGIVLLVIAGAWQISEAATEPDSLRADTTKVYGLDTLRVFGRRIRDPMENPTAEVPSLELSTSTVERTDFARQGAATVTDALTYTPGAWIESRGRKVKQFFSTRGQTYPYPDYALDGAWQREFHELPYFLPTAEIERIEVVRSSAALLKSPTGHVGVVNIVPRYYRRRESAGAIEYGSDNACRAELSHGGPLGSASYALGVQHRHTNGPDGMHAREEMTNLRAGLRWKLSDGLTAQADGFYTDGSRQLARAVAPASARYRNALESFDPFRAALLSLKLDWRVRTGARAELRAHYADRDHVYRNEAVDPVSATPERDHEWGIDLIWAFAMSPVNTLRVGGLYNHWVAPNGKRFYVGRRCDLETVSAVIVDEHRIGRLHLDAGLRWNRTYVNEYGAFNIEGVPRGFGNVEPVRDVWEPAVINTTAGVTFYHSEGQSFHANLAFGSIRPRTGTLDVALQEPARERRLKAEVGARVFDRGLGSVSVTGFAVRQSDAIVLSGRTTTVNDRVMELYENRDQRRAGLEVEARSARLFDSAELFVNLTAVRARAEGEDGMVRDREQPRLVLGGGLSGEKGGYDFGLFWKALSEYENDRFADDADGPPLPRPLGDFLTLSATAGRAFGNRNRTRVYLEVHNLTDRRFSTVVGYPDFGRRVTAGLRQVLR